VWATTVQGRQLHFHLAGINNQNFIMRDKETGSWWQQVTGEAILGPLKGARLTPVLHDELTFAVWRREQTDGRVLRPDPHVAASNYAPADWEARMQRVPVATNDRDASATQRTLVVGLTTDGAARAYPLDLLVAQNPVNDKVGDTPVLLVVNEDGRSVRAFERVLDGRAVEFFAKSESPANTARCPCRLLDAATGSEWDFTGRATSGALAGRQLKQLPVLYDYWFDWHSYNPHTTLYRAGAR
jgi:hypothetical protein